MKKHLTSTGFALPTVIVTSLALLMTIFAITQTVISVRSLSLSQYYTKIAEEAAEAGVTYATACLEKNNRIQTWTDTNKLRQNTKCDGSTASGVGSVLVASDNRIQTEFEVGDLDYSSANATQTNAVQISAKGLAKIKLGATSSFAKTYEVNIKKIIVWNSDLNGQRSTSGSYRTCAIMSGSVYCWGRNRYGQLGNGQSIGTGSDPTTASSVDTTVPVKVVKDPGVLAGTIVVDVFSAEAHNCALTTAGKVYCWGYNGNGQLGNGTTAYSAVPIEVKGALSGKIVTGIGGTGSTSCAIAEAKIYCWGDNSSGTVGNNSTNSYFSTPQLVDASSQANRLLSTYAASKLSTSGSRSKIMCAVADDQAWCWGGDAQNGSIGNGSTNSIQRSPAKVIQEAGLLLGKKVVAISQDGFPDTDWGASLVHACALATNTDGSNGRMYCWGDNLFGQLGNGTKNNYSAKPVLVSPSVGSLLYGKTITDMAVGVQHSCAVADGDVYCWGYNSNGQLGNGTNTSSSLPVAVAKLQGGLLGQTVTKFGSGSNRSCAIASGKTYCWGRNSEGQVGDGTIIDRNIPTESLFLRPKNNQYIY